MPGKYKVTILSYDQTGPKVPDNSMPGEGSLTQYRERIPIKYNAETILTAEVVVGKPNKFDFVLD